MIDPKRLLADPETNAFQRELIASFRDERPSADAKKRTLAALGISVVASGMAASSATASIAPKATGASILVKWVLLSLLVVSSVASVGLYVKLHASNEVHEAAVSSPARAPATTASPLASSVGSSVTVSDLPLAPVSPAASSTAGAPGISFVAPSHGARVAASSSASTLGAELASMDRARAALDSGDAPSAIARIDEYEARYKNGAFTQEAEALRVQALLAENDRASAERAGKRFLARYPESPHADRVRRLLGNPK